MSYSNVPFAKLRAVLLGLGFDERLVEGKYLSFYDTKSDWIFVFPRYRPEDKVSTADLITVRKQLDWRGLLSEQAFDAALRKASA